MNRKQGPALGFVLSLDREQAPVRKRAAPAVRPMDDRRRKKPRRRPDHLAEAGE